MHNQGPHVSILMATHNGAVHLPQQLQSLSRQTHKNWSLWVSDDGSTDETLEILDEFSVSHPVTVVKGPCMGAAAPNFLSLLCHEDVPPGYVALADQDDVWMDVKLSRALRRMASLPVDGPQLYAAESILTDERLAPLRISRARDARPGFANSLVQNLFGGHTTVLNPEAFALIRKAGIQSEIAFHDWWIYQVISGAGGHLLLDRRPTAYYRQHVDNSFGGVTGLSGPAKRLTMTMRRDFARMIERQAEALWQISHLLTPDARAVLEEFRAAPRSGPARIATFRKLGIARASRAGTAAFMAAAFFGRF